MVSASLVLLGAAHAQTTTVKPETKTKEEEVLTLSPFVVDASKDEGYRANSTLAGSRISTSLKDLSAPITIVTKELMNDVGAVSVNDILSYTAGTEGTREFTDAPSSLGRPVDNVAANPNGAIRIRGLGLPQTFRDYFRSLSSRVGFDTYNLDQLTISKGPNSVLAGLGSASGIINYSPQLAYFGKDTNEVAFRFGSYGSVRGTFNSNYTALKDVFAVRVAGAWTDDKFKQKPSSNKDKRLYAALSYAPWAKTTFRLSYETVKVDSNRPNSLTPEDGVSSWAVFGKPSYDRSTGAVGATLFHDGNGPLVVYNKDGSMGTAYNPTSDYVYVQQPFQNIASFTYFRMNNNNQIALNKVNLSPSQNTSKFHALNLSVDQEIAPNLNANISFVDEGSSGYGYNLFRAEYSQYLVDVNMKTVTGAPNPHYGETYMQYRGLDNKYTNDNSNRVVRGTLTYSLDLQKYNKWLGRYALTAFAEDNKQEFQSTQYNIKSSDAGAKLNQEVSARYYLGGTSTTPAVTVPKPPSLVSAVPFVNPNGTTETLTSYFWKKSDNKQKESLKSTAFIVQGYFWEDQIVGMFGYRKDKDKNDFASVTDPGGVDSTTGQLKPIGPFSDSPAISGKTKSYGVVYHTPLKWLSLHYNRGNTFQPNSGTQELDGTVTPPPAGHGKDYGFSVDVLENKLNLKVNWFDLVAANDPAPSANFPVAQWTLPFQELTVMPAIATAAGITYKKAMAASLTTGDPRLANAYTANTVAKGVELELTYNVTKNWRVSANLTKQEAKQSGIAANLTTFIDERLAYWKSIPALWSTRYSSASLPATQWGGQPDGTVSGEGMWNQYSNSYVLAYKSSEGKPNQQLRKWSGNLTTNYQFYEGSLKGWSVGGSLHYRDKTVIGNPAIYQVINGVNTAVGLDVDHPYTASGYVSLDTWVGYKTKIWHDKYDLSVTLNVRDLQEGGGFRPIGANSDGAHSIYQIVQPRTWFLTTTLNF